MTKASALKRNTMHTVWESNKTSFIEHSIVTHDGLSNRKNNKQMFLNMVYALPSLQWLLRTVSAYSEPAGATFLATLYRKCGAQFAVQHNASPDKNSDHRNGVFLDATGIKPCPDLSPNQNALRIASGTEPTLIRKEDTTPLISCPVLCSLHHCKRWHRWSTFNGRQSSGRYTGDGMPLLQLSDHSSTCEVIQVISSSHISRTDYPAGRMISVIVLQLSSSLAATINRFLTAHVVWNALSEFARETTLLLIPNSAATLVTGFAPPPAFRSFFHV
ncbi:uncharacterized protein TNCV_5078321 [Trichonephila clavipes]|nr:uncharacterized protein TNCV_5078321 [Trichonephila clavipes]